MTSVRLLPAEGRRPRQRDGILVPADGILADLDTDIHLRRLHDVGDLVLAPDEAPAPAAAAIEAPAEPPAEASPSTKARGAAAKQS